MSWSTFKERITNLMNKERTIQRDASAERRDINAEPALEKLEHEAEEHGQVAKVVKYLHRIDELERHEAMRLFDIFIQLRLLTIQHLHRLKNVEMEIRREPTLRDEERREFLEALEHYRKTMQKCIESTFQAVTSVDSTNLSLMQNLADAASQVEDMLYQAKQGKRAERKLRNDERSLARTKTTFKKMQQLFNRYDDDLKRLVPVMGKLIMDAINLLRRDKQNVKRHAEHIRELIIRSGFPATIGHDLEAEYNETERFISHKISEEIAKERVELSEAEHAKV